MIQSKGLTSVATRQPVDRELSGAGVALYFVNFLPLARGVSLVDGGERDGFYHWISKPTGLFEGRFG